MSPVKAPQRIRQAPLPESRTDGRRQRSLQRPLDLMMKRLLDVTLSLPVVLLVLPPLCVIIKLVHALQSSGPLFFCQTRCGRDGRLFTVIKFRTLHPPKPGQSELDADMRHRQFPAGEFLRASRIDELPQFINVLVGTMSIVGPRPHHEQDHFHFSQASPEYAQRLVVKPGITGLAQYKEYRGSIRFNCTASRVRKDLDYIDRWTLLLDLVLILKTSRVIGRAVLNALSKRQRLTVVDPRQNQSMPLPASGGLQPAARPESSPARRCRSISIATGE